ncbi:endopeptidase La [Caldisericum exile]|uniref:Lon protease n=1 Tax=Caldisericum exile (strain DSM 21853 / NBRC 104410 / AZM16c01) TaxID=511051 RepID=A0A7U6GEE0_CALEA|nr:endopeptidase La [Caldisericum exile]BAL80851.1 ATP-dependent protease La [Caldisericum exile AZM16c01]
MNERNFQKSYAPYFPLRGIVIFPHMVVPLIVGRPKSINAIEEALSTDKLIVVSTQKNGLIEEPEPKDVYDVGVGCEIIQVLRLPDGTYRIIVEGIERVKIKQFDLSPTIWHAHVEPLKSVYEPSTETEALMRLVSDKFALYSELNKKVPQDAILSLTNIDSPDRLIMVVISNLFVSVEEKQKILETTDVKEQLKYLHEILERENTILEISRKIDEEVRNRIEKSQKEYFLREKLKEIERELGEEGEGAGTISEIKNKMKGRKLPKYVIDKINEELEKLKKIPPMSPESGVIQNYIDWLLALPWDKSTVDTIDVKKAQEILDKNHYDLKDVKERILELIAVKKLKSDVKGPILCFVGPPGVGKTSLGKSIAEALGRKFVRVSLGGIRDEAEIRGHRRTYVGALPGRIIQGIKQAGVKNPVFLLDEIDKVGADFRGDPTAALLEALDPEQNNAFSDHYIELPFDLSEVLFITTANVVDTIPPALLDRMEVLTLPGYIDEEKLQIAKKFIIPKQLVAHGLESQDLVISDKAILKIINEYTREAGLRNLERSITKIIRKVAKEKAERGKIRRRITEENLRKYLGKPEFERESQEKKSLVGVACGMVVTLAGGDIVYIEATKMPGKGSLILTGQLGEVMKESAQAALSYIRANAEKLGVQPDFYDKYDIHIHVPEGAVPKEGPSAGITMFVALVSVLKGVPVNKDVAMTGEITLRGRVLPVGGIKEKVLGAYRANIRTIILPKANEIDIEDIPEGVRNNIRFYFIENVEEALNIALENEHREST